MLSPVREPHTLEHLSVIVEPQFRRSVVVELQLPRAVMPGPLDAPRTPRVLPVIWQILLGNVEFLGDPPPRPRGGRRQGWKRPH